MKWIATYLTGLLFGVGISLSGMANPAKVLNFFDIAGSWDPSLLFVMGGALVTTLVGYKLVFGRAAPVFESRFSLPTASRVDAPLVAGSALFGVGWGIAGFCPGGALPALGTGDWQVGAFVVALATGILGTRFLQSAIARPARAPS